MPYGRQGKYGIAVVEARIRDLGLIAYQEHKVTSVSRSDGSEKIVERVLVTTKGLARLAMIVPGV